MAGVKGKSGGPRANSGGVRPGAGRKPAPPPEIGDVVKARKYEEPTEFLMDLMNDSSADPKMRLDAAKALLTRFKNGGKKEELGGKAAKAGTGKFGASSAPSNVVSIGAKR